MSTKRRFWTCAILALPILITMFLMPFHIMLPDHGAVLTTLILIIGASGYYQSAWHAFLHHQANMNSLIAIGTGVTYLYSLYAFFNGKDVYFESAAFITVFMLLGDMLEEKMRSQASDSLSELLKLQANHALVKRDDKFVDLPIDEIKIGDLVQVRPGDRIPIDGEIVEGKSEVNEAAITGESKLQVKGIGDQVYGATVNTTGAFILRVTKTSKETVLAQIVSFVRKAQTSKAPIQKLTDRVANYFVPIVLIIGIITFWAWSMIEPAQALERSIAVIIIACPCALGLATPTAMIVGIGQAAKLGILIKNGTSLEKANNIETVVFDKTGTLTTGDLSVKEVTGENTLQVAADLEQYSEHPIARAILKDQHPRPVSDFKTVPGLGVTAKQNGHLLMAGNAKFFDRPNDDRIFVGIDHQLIGTIKLEDMPKSEAKSALAQLPYRKVMMTGDNERIAKEIADSVGITEFYANQLPQDKAEHIQKLSNVAFVGDGINDAPALSVAKLGIVMGSGSEIALESGDIIITNNNLHQIKRALDISKRVFQKIKLNLFWASIYNLIGIPIAAIFTLSPVIASLAMALSSVSVVLNSLTLKKP
ncbi:MAG: copper-translocating P-type ATPase [Lactobacillus sp.]|nr:copper-translocating P-type ATPase [Lactobacillus sp.]